MNEYQLWDLLASYGSLILSDQALFFSEVSAYLVVSYLVGAKLTRFQLVFLNFLLISVAAISTVGVTNNVLDMVQFSRELNALQSGTDSFNANFVGWFFVSLRAIIIIGCFIFMQQIRSNSKQARKR